MLSVLMSSSIGVIVDFWRSLRVRREKALDLGNWDEYDNLREELVEKRNTISGMND
jgi:hypothetical protein